MRAHPDDRQPEDYCQHCWLKEMLKLGAGSKKDEGTTLDSKLSKKRAVEETGLEASMVHLSLQARGPGVEGRERSCQIIDVRKRSGLGTVGKVCATENPAD